MSRCDSTRRELTNNCFIYLGFLKILYKLGILLHIPMTIPPNPALLSLWIPQNLLYFLFFTNRIFLYLSFLKNSLAKTLCRSPSTINPPLMSLIQPLGMDFTQCSQAITNKSFAYLGFFKKSWINLPFSCISQWLSHQSRHF